MTDEQLLREYQDQRSERSFAELVHRHIHWVHSSAFRQVGNRHLADDVTQAVFIALAQKIKTFSHEVVLAAWLFGVTRRVATNALRSQSRRKRHEQRAATMKSENEAPTEILLDEQLAVELDRSVARLREQDRKVLLLRFFQQMTFAEVAGVLRISEDAAKKRAERAIGRLQDVFKRRGLSDASGLVAGGALEHLVVPVHAELIHATVSIGWQAASAMSVASAPFALAKSAVALATWTKAIIAAAAAATVLLVGVAGFLAVGRAAGTAQVQEVIDPGSQASVMLVAKPGELSGMVTDEAGKPLSGVLVDVWTWQPGNETKTDQGGHFVLTKLGAKPVEIRFSHDGYGPWYNPNQDTGITDMRIVLSNKTYFEGDVKLADGKPAGRILVRADSGPKQNTGVMISNLWTEAWTDVDGHYRMYVMPDKYDFQIRVPSVGAARFPEMVIAAGESKRLDIDLTPGVKFQAIAIDTLTGDPIAGVALSNWQHTDIKGVSDKNGLIVIDDMQPGNFQFEVEAKGYTRWWSADATKDWEQKDLSGAFQRNFDDLDFNLVQAMKPVKIELEPEVKITGIVEDPNGKPVAGATVAPALTGSGNSLTGDTRFSVMSGRDGTFVMSLPASGGTKYNLEAHDGKYNKWRKWANGVVGPMKTQPADELKDVVIKLTRPAVVRGHVLDDSGEPAIGREVVASASDKMENRYYDPTTKTDARGNFELKFVRAGEQDISCPLVWMAVGGVPGDRVPKVVVVHLTLKEGEVKEGVELRAAPPVR